ncbi:hypothetical protein R3W88_016312 [Solanum pinnatisectum]|uniref:Uncharacterized protein n=1 Tax=Solanum pinnatisectum TaxID=50273 RepID=A0AAV9KXG3_9SOLN|nr:hypothetical protein R3W88_016312 [Solanum pinnatisectum]
MNRDGPHIDTNALFPVQPAGDNSHTSAIHLAEVAARHEEADDHHTKTRALENSAEETQSSNFSFGIKANSMHITSTSNLCVVQDTNQGRYMEKAGHDEQQMDEQTNQRHQDKGEEVQPGQSRSKNAMQNVDTNTEAHLRNVANEQISRITDSSEQVVTKITNIKKDSRSRLRIPTNREKLVEFNRATMELKWIIEITFRGYPTTMLGMSLIL